LEGTVQLVPEWDLGSIPATAEEKEGKGKVCEFLSFVKLNCVYASMGHSNKKAYK
jgi:hypothetical protein